jgi:hypothetical protein
MAFGQGHPLFPTRLPRSTAILAALALVGLLCVLRPVAARADGPCDVQNGLGSFSSSNRPGDCWRPYSDSSPFNQTVPAGAPRADGSGQMVGGLLDGGPVTQLVFGGDPQRDGGVSVYWSQPSDPVYTLHCTKDWGNCPLEGQQIHLPAGALPTGGFATPGNVHDAHLTVMDQASGWEYDMWYVTGESGNTIDFGWGGKTRIDGDGLGSGAVAAGYGSLAGSISPEELQDGLIDHALAMVVPCTDSKVYPAQGTGISCSDAGLPDSLAIPMGSHFQLAMTKGAIRRLNVPAWKKTILTALSTYGAYVSDTTGVADQWGFETESGWSYTSLGQQDPWVQWAKSRGVQPQDFNHNGYAEYWFDLASGVNWHRMRVLSPCTADGSCPIMDRSVQLRRRVIKCRVSLRRWNRRREHSNHRTHHRRKRWSRHCRALARRV